MRAIVDSQAATGSDLVCNRQDWRVIKCAEAALARGLSLKKWWQRIDSQSRYAETFQVVRSFHTPDSSFGFFDQATVGGRTVPIMGLVEDGHYDYAKGDLVRISDELREFVLRYFLRVTDFRRPRAYVETTRGTSRIRVPGISWCGNEEPKRGGFGYSQHYFKRRGSGVIESFTPEERFAIVDVRTLFDAYDWVVLKVQLFDFDFDVRPAADAPRVVVPLTEESYLVVSRDFVIDEGDASTDIIRTCGFGYAFIQDPAPRGSIAYGPGRFEVAFKLIQFRLLRSGEIRVKLVFAANRPESILNVSLDPIRWGLTTLNVLSLGLVSRLLGPIEEFVSSSDARFDPVGVYISAANALTGGIASDELCISRATLERYFLLRHFEQHYDMLAGSLLTWRGVADWRDEDAVPEWVHTGVTS
jgi:hypothetical protein